MVCGYLIFYSKRGLFWKQIGKYGKCNISLVVCHCIQRWDNMVYDYLIFYSRSGNVSGNLSGSIENAIFRLVFVNVSGDGEIYSRNGNVP